MTTDVNGHTVLNTQLPHEPKAILSLFDAIPALVASMDGDMKIQFANQSFQKWFSPTHEIVGTSFARVAGKEVFDQVQPHLWKASAGKSANFNIVVQNEHGHRYLEANLCPEFDETKNVKGFIFQGVDITERFNVQHALHDYFENASIGLHWVNAEGKIIWANRAELEMLGYQEHEYIGQDIARFHKSQSDINDILGRLSRNEVLQNYEAELVCKDGSSRYVAINSSVLWEEGKFVHTRCFTIDITQQKLAAKAVKESEDRFKVMADLVPFIIWTTDSNGQCNFLSTRWKTLTGKNTEDGLGNRWLEVVHPHDREKIHNSWSQSLLARKPFEGKFRILNANGEYAIYYANSIPQDDSGGAFMGFIGIFQDISTQEQIKSSLEKIVLDRTEDLRRKNLDLKAAEEAMMVKNQELEKINKELSSFAHVASHDLQEPLRKIQTFVDRVLQLEGKKFSDRGIDFFSRIQAAARRMQALIEDLLEYSKTKNALAKFEPIDLNQLLNEVIEEYELKIEEKKAIVENRGLPILKVVKFQFRQLFINLINNALKFSRTDTQPHIIIQSEVVNKHEVPLENGADQYYHISITDNGIGFEPEFSEKIFELFHRLHGRSEFEGTGIGLAICKKIMENHNGLMTAEGKLNQGATFHIYLPLNTLPTTP